MDAKDTVRRCQFIRFQVGRRSRYLVGTNAESRPWSDEHLLDALINGWDTKGWRNLAGKILSRK
jgi:hypothetical protein